VLTDGYELVAKYDTNFKKNSSGYGAKVLYIRIMEKYQLVKLVNA